MQQFWPENKCAALSISFDDARVSQVPNGIPILDEYDIKGTFYVMSQSVEANIDGWKAAVANGHEIGNHTVTHPCSGNFSFARNQALEDLSLERMEKEFHDADDAIKVLLNVSPQTFAYPCGQTYVGRGENTQSYVPLVAKHFLAGRGFNGESANDPAYCDLAQLIAIPGDVQDFALLEKHLDKALQDGSWLILAMHDVGDYQQSISKDALRAICEYTKAHPELWTDTVANIATYIKSQR
ncbi:MAG: polysaccharide deacetylase family protein [Abditibacteriaceae bacterium]